MSYDIDRITELENEKKLKVKKLTKMQRDNEKLKRTKAKHLKEIEEINAEGDWDVKKDVLVRELREGKTMAREKYYENLEKKKELINKHENVVLLDVKIRKMQKLIELKRKENPNLEKEDQNSAEANKINELGDKVKEATKIMEFEEKKAQIELHRQEAELSNLQHEVDIAALKLREKQQEFRLCELKIKELKRQTRHNALKPLDFGPTPSDSIKTQGPKSYREPEQLRLCEENLKKFDREREEDDEFYSNYDDNE